MLTSTSISTLNSTASRHNHAPNQIVSQSYKIITQYGDMLVVKQSLQSQQQGSSSSTHSGQPAADPQQQPQRPVIMTFHDIGLNSELQFSNFCECEEMKLMLQTFTMLHVNLIGQEFRASGAAGWAPCERLPDDFKYPTVEQLSECIVDVCAQLRVRSFIGLAVGAGAYIASSLALMRPDLVDGLFLINPVFSSCSITEWLYFKMSAIASNQSVSNWSAGRDHAPAEGAGSPHASSLRRLLNAAHIHLPQSGGDSAGSTPAHDASEAPGGAPGTPPGGGAGNRQPASNRLRQLIFSRSVRCHQQAPAAASRTSSMSSQEPDEGHADAELRAPSRRPPLEYLMYHHFGPSSARRSSDSSGSGLAGAGSKGSLSGGSGDSPGGESPRARAGTRRRLGRRDSSRSQDGHSGAGTPSRSRRSGSLCLTASYLASLPSERNRSAHIQAVYRQYFSQLNAHNLWLLAHSFAKRRTLNLRKDCGAAAHAAAAAAFLGTSICTAFAQTGALEGPQAHGAAAGCPPAAAKQAHGREQPQVAGTKVKRTFTCQTLIMCSTVQTHCERAFKLMSLLNPLQATWIKTDHLLVLEERPDKVCQALRLFLQGIGYSMSTYERRLRLSWQTGSQSSAESTGSGRSLSEKG